jgi:GT2 family glycosyltransferase
VPADIDIVIVNWNAGDMLRDCVQSALDTGKDLLGRIIVVDNGSTDQSLERLPKDARIVIVRTGENLGFGRACNRGAALGSSRFLLFLNPDTRLYSTTLDDVQQFMDSPGAQQVGVCGIRLIEDDGSVQQHTTEYPGPLNVYQVDRFRTSFDHESDRTVPHVIGAFYFIRRKVFDIVGGFDEQFFVYFEDLDLSLRVTQAGWDIFYLSTASAYHKGGGTSDSIKARRLFYSVTSRLQYSRKHFSTAGYLTVLAMTLTVEPAMRLARALAKRSGAQAQETIDAYRLLLGPEGPFRARHQR